MRERMQSPINPEKVLGQGDEKIVYEHRDNPDLVPHLKHLCYNIFHEKSI